MSVDNTTFHADNAETTDAPLNPTERELIDDLILQNKTLDALIKGLLDDIETFKKESAKNNTAPDVVRFTMQLNIMKDKKARNLAAINTIIKEHHQLT